MYTTLAMVHNTFICRQISRTGLDGNHDASQLRCDIYRMSQVIRDSELLLYSITTIKIGRPKVASGDQY